MERSTRSRLRRQGAAVLERGVALGKTARRVTGWGAAALAALALTAPARADITLNEGHGPVRVRVPSSYDGSKPMPLIVLLHPLGTNGAITELYFNSLRALAETEGFLLMAPDAPDGFASFRFWKILPWQDEDSLYLRRLIDAACEELAVDENAISAVGHSLGGVMAYRLACDHPERISAVVSLAGAMLHEPVRHHPRSPVHVLQIHGTKDDLVYYEGSTFTQGARQSVLAWVGMAECGEAEEVAGEPLDLDLSLDGVDTDVMRWSFGCSPYGSGELWRINDGGHIPIPSATFGSNIWSWLRTHRRGVGDEERPRRRGQ